MSFEANVDALDSSPKHYEEYHPYPRFSKSDSQGFDHLLKIDPPILIFAGFFVNTPQVQKLKITNIAASAQRVNIFLPSSEAFEFFFSKKGKLAPGMSQEISVKLTAKTYKVFETAIRVQTEVGLLSIPIKAFPVMTFGKKEVFPRKINFGWSPLNEKQILTKRLESAIDLEFEFNFQKIGVSPEINVFPMNSRVPGNGHIDITFVFTPAEVGKKKLEFEVN